eukprot:scaffold9139_cov64-Phaeocystis_antarctica.AAC.1
MAGSNGRAQAQQQKEQSSCHVVRFDSSLERETARRVRRREWVGACVRELVEGSCYDGTLPPQWKTRRRFRLVGISDMFRGGVLKERKAIFPTEA